MPDMLEEFTRDFIDRFLKTLPIEKRLEGLPAEEFLKRLPVEKRLQGLSAQERLEGLPAEERLQGLSLEDVLAALSPQDREALAKRLQTNGSEPKLE